jgi:hypothetical protein
VPTVGSEAFKIGNGSDGTTYHPRSVLDMSLILAERTEETHDKLQSCSRPACQDSDTEAFVCIDVTAVHEISVLAMLGLMERTA